MSATAKSASAVYQHASVGHQTVVNDRFIVAGNIVLTTRTGHLSDNTENVLWWMSRLQCSVHPNVFWDKIKRLGPRRYQKLPEEMFDTETNQLVTDKGDTS